MVLFVWLIDEGVVAGFLCDLFVGLCFKFPGPVKSWCTKLKYWMCFPTPHSSIRYFFGSTRGPRIQLANYKGLCGFPKPKDVSLKNPGWWRASILGCLGGRLKGILHANKKKSDLRKTNLRLMAIQAGVCWEHSSSWCCCVVFGWWTWRNIPSVVTIVQKTQPKKWFLILELSL